MVGGGVEWDVPCAEVALTYANELPADAERVIEVKSKQVGELFDAAVATVEGAAGAGGGAGGGVGCEVAGASTSFSSSSSCGVPSVAVGEGGDGTGWESALWVSLVRRAKAAADAAGVEPPADGSYDAATLEFDVDWEGLKAAGIVTESKPPPPPPPLELVRAYVDVALGEYDNSLQRRETVGGGGGETKDELSSAAPPPLALVERSVFTVKQRGMPPGFAATIILEVRGSLEGGDAKALTNQIYMLMPGAAANSVMKVPMGSIPAEDLPQPAALRRGGAEVTVGGLSTSGGGSGGRGSSGPVTYRFNPADGSFTADKERLSAGRLVEIVETPPSAEGGGGGSVAVVLVKKEGGGQQGVSK